MTKLRTSTIAAVVLLGASAQAVLAQDEEPAATETQAEIGVQAKAELSPEAQLEQGKEIEQRGQRLSARIQKMLDAARQEGDIIKVTCLNDKLTQSNASLRTVQQRLQGLQDTNEVGDRSAANHEFTVLTVLSQKFSLLDQEANQCVGQDVYEPGAAQVVTTADENKVPRDVDPLKVPAFAELSPAVTIPPPVSGVM